MGIGVEKVVESSWQDCLCACSVCWACFQELLQLGGCLLLGSKPEAPEGQAGSRRQAGEQGCAWLCWAQPTCSFRFHISLFREFFFSWVFSQCFLQLAPEPRERERERADVRALRKGWERSFTLSSFSFSWELKPRQLSQLPPRALFLEREYCFSSSQSASALRLSAGFLLSARKVKLRVLARKDWGFPNLSGTPERGLCHSKGVSVHDNDAGLLCLLSLSGVPTSRLTNTILDLSSLGPPMEISHFWSEI